ncbi:MAG: PDZ domain-containing protein [Lachnospiraceae bacterium]|nr:PDZ domain-containing protein [Lachnospiraceae bacterium]MCI9204163.1 PDZ domain-containing protein [Lachnospiraceae bacterium]MCI9335155.1 PDZ domain-containing protein [Lachnospiraceae bacterium]
MEERKNQDHSDFMKETIKQRPLNRRKLVRRTLLTAAMAVIFGMVACFTFLLLEPVISNKLYPEEEPEIIEFVEESREDEILPEDMIVDDSQMQPEPTQPPALEDEQIAQVLSEMKLGVEDYLSLFAGIREVAREVRKSIVTVVGVTPDVGWLDNEYENEGAVSGIVVADNGIELLILADVSSIEDAQSLEVAFQDGEIYQATLMKKDNNTGLAVISIAKTKIKSTTLEMAVAANLGTSGSSLVGIPVIALGRPMGTEGSLCYGNITSTGNVIRLPDSNYKLMTTDIYGSSSASGVLINLRGQVVGIIDMSKNSPDLSNLISAVGISDLKKLVESLSNDKDIAYFGVYGADVTESANEELGVPLGAYITEIDMDSPAMNAGIQSGDVILKWNDMEIESYQDLVSTLLLEEPEKTVSITLMRQGPEGYTEMETTAVLGLK